MSRSINLNLSISIPVVLILHVLNYKGLLALKDVRILATELVKSGDTIRLVCEYDLENVPLYSIKWYFKENEFYRFVPKESPPTRVFPVYGLTVDVSQSDNKSVTLCSVQTDLTGTYKCEVSADGPLFHTDIKQIFVNVIEKPHTIPVIDIEKIKYTQGETIRANCTSKGASPATNLTWFVNNQNLTERNFTFVKYYSSLISNYSKTLKNSQSTLELLVTSDVFSRGKLTLACEATQFTLYKERTELNLFEDAPQLAHVSLFSTSNSDRSNGKIIDFILRWLTFCFTFGLYFKRR